MAYIFGGDTQETPESIKRKREMLRAIAARSSRMPQNVGEGLNSVGQALLYRKTQSDIQSGEQAGMESANNAFSSLFGPSGGGMGEPAGAPGGGGMGAPVGAPGGGMGQYRDAIASIESAGSGDYKALGPETGGDRAYGRYQVMGANIGPWTKEALGKELTPQEFLANPEIQDKVFDHKFGQYVDKYGNPQDAASMWFTGRPAAEGANRKDVLGTSGKDYVSKFTSILGGGGKPQRGAAPAASGVDPRIAQVLSNRFATPGQKAIASALLQKQMNPPQRQMVKGADGMNYYADTGERVLPNVQPPAPAPVSVGAGSALVNPQSGEIVYQGENKPTTAVQEYEYAKAQGFPGSFSEFQTSMKRAGATTINTGPSGIDYGEPPKGYAWMRDEQGKVRQDEDGLPMAKPFKGGPAYAAQEEAAKAGEKGAEVKGVSTGIVLQDIDRAITAIEASPGMTTGVGGALMQDIPGMPARDVKGLVDTIRANVGFDKLQAMREASKTGGALGAVSEFENKMLQATMGNLEQSQNSKQMLYNLRRLKFVSNALVNGVPDGQGGARRITQEDIAAFDGTAGIDDESMRAPVPPQAAPQAAPDAAPQAGVVEDGYRFKGGDPADPANWERVQ